MRFLTPFCGAIILSLVSFSSIQVYAQQYCGFDQVLQKLAAENPGFQERCQELHAHAVRGAKSAQERQSVVHQIPVVFHIVYNTEAQNLPDEVIFDQMEILNQDYRRQNPNASDTRDIFLPVAADTEIEFALAWEDPEGNPTTGIQRYETENESFFMDLLSADEITLDEVKFAVTGGADAWDTDRYLNIWVCNVTASFGAQLFGFAYPPLGAENWEEFFPEIDPAVQGVVVHYTAIGSNNSEGLSDGFEGNEGGRTLTHEIGHFLGLRHTWGDGFFNGCTVDDGISDTPNIDANNNFTCTFDSNSCDEGEGDLPDMSENYMDYNQDDCLNIFTQEQKEVMRWNLENLRPGLLDGGFVLVADQPQPELKMWPNPADQTVSISIPTRGSLRVSDMSGRVLLLEKVNEGTRSLDLSAFARGIYTVQIANEKTTFTGQLIHY